MESWLGVQEMCAGPKCTFSEHVWIKKRRRKKVCSWYLRPVMLSSCAAWTISGASRPALGSFLRCFSSAYSPAHLPSWMSCTSILAFFFFFFYSSLYAERLFLIISHKTSDEAKSYFAACKAELVHGEVQKESDFKKRRKKSDGKTVLCVQCLMLLWES